MHPGATSDKVHTLGNASNSFSEEHFDKTTRTERPGKNVINKSSMMRKGCLLRFSAAIRSFELQSKYEGIA